MRDPARRSRLDRARGLSNAAWRRRSAPLSSSTTDTAEREETGRLVREQLAEAAALCREAGDDRELTTVLRRLGHAEQDAGYRAAATACYEEAVDAARRTGDALLLAHAVRHLGDAHRAARRLAAAETCYAEALGVYVRHPDPPPLDHANAIRPMAILKEALGETEDAHRLWRQARTLYAAVPIAAGVAECEENISRLG